MEYSNTLAQTLQYDKQPVPDTGLGTLDENLWNPLISNISADPPERTLKKMGLLADDQSGTTRATVAGILLCTARPSQWLPCACIRAARYAGPDQASKRLDTQTIDGPLNAQIALALAFARRNTRCAARQDLPEYSDEALFEAIVNAVTHRDYSIHGSCIRLLIFDDHIKLYSPGNLPNNLPVDNMETRQSTRNEILASALGRIPVHDMPGTSGRQHFMEQRGYGVPIIKKATYALCGKYPQYQLIDRAELCLTLPAAPCTNG